MKLLSMCFSCYCLEPVDKTHRPYVVVTMFGTDLNLLDCLLKYHQWMFGIWLITLSIVFDFYWFIKTKMAFLCRGSFASHEDKVKKIQYQIRKKRDSETKTSLSTNRMRRKSAMLQKHSYDNYISRVNRILAELGDILFLDKEKQIVRVEPMVTIGHLKRYLFRNGWMLPIFPELEEITLGNLVMGRGIESTSVKYGLFQYTCRAYEVVLADASVVWCSKSQNRELFGSFPFSFGALGFLTAIELHIIPFKPYVKLTYIPVHSLHDIVEELTRMSDDLSIDSVEGIVYSTKQAVIMSGVFVDHVEKGKLNRVGQWYQPWFYKHVEEYVRTGPGVEFIPTRDFINRHKRSFFWLMHQIVPFGNNFAFRLFLGWTMPPKVSLLKYFKETFQHENAHRLYQNIIQDYCFDLKELLSGLIFTDIEYKIYPLWLCPIRHCIPEGLEYLSTCERGTVQVNVGVYGVCPIREHDPVASYRRMERFAMDKHSAVAMIAETQNK